MDCHRCLEAGADLVELSYPDGGSHRLYLCDRCHEAFEDDVTVKEVSVAQPN